MICVSISYLKLDDSSADESGHKGSNHLTGEGNARWDLESISGCPRGRSWLVCNDTDLDIVRNLKVIGKRDGMGRRDVSNTTWLAYNHV